MAYAAVGTGNIACHKEVGIAKLVQKSLLCQSNTVAGGHTVEEGTVRIGDMHSGAVGVAAVGAEPIVRGSDVCYNTVFNEVSGQKAGNGGDDGFSVSPVGVFVVPAIDGIGCKGSTSQKTWTVESGQLQKTHVTVTESQAFDIAAGEHIASKAHTVGNVKGLERTVAKSCSAYVFKALRQIYRAKIVAVCKGIAADFLNTLGKDKLRKLLMLTEGRIANAGDALGNCIRVLFRAVILYKLCAKNNRFCGFGIGRVVKHAFTDNQTVAAAGNGSESIAACEGIVPNVAEGGGEDELGDALIAVEGLFTDALKTLGKNNTCVIVRMVTAVIKLCCYAFDPLREGENAVCG